MKFTKEQRIAITGFTGIMACKDFSEFHEDVEKRLGYPVFTHQFGNQAFADKIKDLYEEEFISYIED